MRTLLPETGSVNPLRTGVGATEVVRMRQSQSRTTWRQILERLQREHTAGEIIAAARAIVEREVVRCAR